MGAAGQFGGGQDGADRDGGERDEGQDQVDDAAAVLRGALDVVGEEREQATQLGRDYALAIILVISELNREVAGRVSPAQLAAADAVLRAALFDDSARQRASRVPPPPGR